MGSLENGSDEIKKGKGSACSLEAAILVLDVARQRWLDQMGESTKCEERASIPRRGEMVITYC